MVLPLNEQRVGAGGTGGAPQWVAGPQKAGALVFNAGNVYRVKQDIANGQTAPTATNAFYLKLPVYNDPRLVGSSDDDPAAPLSRVPVAGWGLTQKGGTIGLLRDAANVPLPPGQVGYSMDAAGNVLPPSNGGGQNTTLSPFIGIQPGRDIQFPGKTLANVQHYDLDFNLVQSRGNMSDEMDTNLGVYWFRFVLKTTSGPDTGNLGTSTVYEDFRYILDSSPYVGAMHVDNGIIYPNQQGVLDLRGLTGGTPGTGRNPYEVDTAKRKEVVDANLAAYPETDSSYYGKEFVDEVRGPGKPAYYKCIPSAPATSAGVTVWKWFRIDIL